MDRKGTKFLNLFGFLKNKATKNTYVINDYNKDEIEEFKNLYNPVENKTLDDEHKWKLKEFLRKNECYDININIGIMQYLSKCKAKMPIIMVQDILGLDENSRINVPGVESDQNWSWKLINFDDLKERIKDY